MHLNEIQLSQLLDQARTYVNEGKHLHAEQLYHRLIREEPTLLQTYTELATLYAENGKVNAGIRVLEKALGEFPAHEQVLFMLGSFHLQAGYYDRAITLFHKLHGKNLPHVHFNTGIAYFYKGNMKRAEEQFRMTLKLNPTFPKIHESLGELLISRGTFAEAIHHLKLGITVEPYSWVSHHLLGIAYHSLSDLKNAYNEFVIAIEMDPNEALSWQKCGEVLLEMQRYDEAEQYLRKALELRPNFADALANFGQLCLSRGDKVQSEEYFNKALSVDPHHPRAQFGKLQTSRFVTK
jgi:tetratricopeptide (TPR) repeat protein